MDARMNEALQRLDRHIKGVQAAREEIAKLLEQQAGKPRHDERTA